MRPWNQSLVHRTSGVMFSHKCIPSTEAQLHRSFNHGVASRWSGGFQDKAITFLVNNKVMGRRKLIFFPSLLPMIHCSFAREAIILMTQNQQWYFLEEWSSWHWQSLLFLSCYFFSICLMAILILKQWKLNCYYENKSLFLFTTFIIFSLFF